MATSRQVAETTALYRRVEELAVDPPGGIPERWGFTEVQVYGQFLPEQGEWWQAAAEYARTDQMSGTRRLIGAGPTAESALRALETRLGDPLVKRQRETRGGWDTNWRPGRVAEG